MLSSLSLNSASHLLAWSNVIYVVGAVLTLGSAGMVLYEKRSKSLGFEMRWGFTTEIVVIIAAFISLLGTIGAIYFGGRVSHFKDVALSTFQTDSQVKVAQANAKAEQAKADAALANQKAQEAKDNTAKVEAENLALGGKVGANEARAKAAEDSLAKANKDTSDFAHSLQQQQATMAEQAKVSPILTPYQIDALAYLLKPYAGQDVSLHQTSDTVVARLGATLKRAFNESGITTSYFATDMGALYQGVSVAVHDPNDVPPLANTLVSGLRQAGVDVHPVAAPELVQAGKVAVFLGPN